MARLRKMRRCTAGATAIEYALVAALISIACIGAMTTVGGKTTNMFNNVSNRMNQ